MFFNKPLILYSLTIGLVAMTIMIGVSVGSTPIPFSTVSTIIFYSLLHVSPNVDLDPALTNIVLQIRLPRVLLAFFVGSSLSLAGAAFQGLLRNPLADPYTLGVSSGAAVGAVIVLFFGISIPVLGLFTLPVFSILAGFLTLMAILLFARLIEHQLSIETIILTGIIFSSFLGSVISLMIALTGEELRQIIGWLLGSVSMRGWPYVTMMLPFTVIGSLLIISNWRELNALTFGKASARTLGVDVARKKLLLLTAASLLTGAAVAVSGTIGFVGLVIPHLTRMMSGPSHHRLLPLSMLNGGVFLVLADLVARTMISPQELPIGVITALIGAPVFAIIFLQRNKQRS